MAVTKSIPLAKDYLKSKIGDAELNILNVTDLMVEFAKLHVQQTVKDIEEELGVNVTYLYPLSDIN